MIDPTVEFTDPYLGVLRPVPPGRAGVCRVCHSGPNPGYALCASCSQVRFRTDRRLDGTRVLLLDDTLTSGARLQSAASTLLGSGARSVTTLVLGRVINPDWNDACRAIWTWSKDRDFSFDRCCWCGSPE